MPSRAPAAATRRRASAARTRAPPQITARGGDALAAHVDADAARRRRSRSAPARPVRTSPPRLVDEGARRLGVHLVQRPGRQDQRRRRSARARTSPRARARTARPPLRLATDSAPRPRAAPRATRAAARLCPCLRSHARHRELVRRPARGRIARQRAPRRAQRPRHPQHRQPIAPAAAHPSRARRRAGAAAAAARGQRSTERRPCAIEERHAQRRLRAGRCRSAPIRAQERERLAIAAEEHVLAVVDELAGLAIGERRRAAAELRPRVEDEHARAGVGQRGRGAQPGEAARRPRRRRASCVETRRSAAIGPSDDARPGRGGDRRARRGRGMRTTVEKTS